MPKLNVDEVLSEQEFLIGDIGRRIYFLRAYDNELLRLAGVASIQVRNEPVKHLIYDSYSMVVVDLTSICLALFGKDSSFLTQWKAHLKDLSPKRLSIEDFQGREYEHPFIDDPEQLKARGIAYRNRRLEESVGYIQDSVKALFGRNTEEVTLDDLKYLELKFQPIIEKLKSSRDHLAHRHERKERNKLKNKQVTHLELEEIDKIFTLVKEALHHIRFMTTFGQFDYLDHDVEDYEEDAKDLIHLMIDGDLDKIHWQLNRLTEETEIKDFKTLREMHLQGTKDRWLITKEDEE